MYVLNDNLLIHYYNETCVQYFHYQLLLNYVTSYTLQNQSCWSYSSRSRQHSKDQNAYLPNVTSPIRLYHYRSIRSRILNLIASVSYTESRTVMMLDRYE